MNTSSGGHVSAKELSGHSREVTSRCSLIGYHEASMGKLLPAFKAYDIRGIVPTELQDAALQPRPGAAGDGAPRLGAAGERHHADPRVCDQGRTDVRAAI